MPGQDGVFVTTVEAAEWAHDEETGGLAYMLRDDSVQAGLWKPGPVAGTTIEVALEADESFIVLTGSGTLEVDGGPPIDLAPGTLVSLRNGASTTWTVSEDFSEFWVYS